MSYDVIGCGDNSCVFRVLRTTHGMATNGGCRCFKHLEMRGRDNGVDYSNHDAVRRVAQDTQRLSGELRRVKAQRDELLAALEGLVHRTLSSGPCWCFLWPDEENNAENVLSHEGHGDKCTRARAAIAKAKGGGK